jgi:hypothetical protein
MHPPVLKRLCSSVQQGDTGRSIREIYINQLMNNCELARLVTKFQDIDILTFETLTWSCSRVMSDQLTTAERS